MSEFDPCSENPENPCHNDEDYYIIDLNDKDFPEEAYEKHGLRLGLPLFGGLIVLALVVTFVLIKCSRYQEQGKVQKEENLEETKQQRFQDSIICKPWSDNDEEKPCEDMTEATANFSRELSDVSDASEECRSDDGSNATQAAPAPRSSTPRRQLQQSRHQKDGSECAICSKEFAPGQMIYESNNPQCGHRHHKACMENWLKFQNTCPQCNHPFVLQTV